MLKACHAVGINSHTLLCTSYESNLNSGLKFFLSRLILHFHLLWIRARRQTKLRISQQLATKLVETLCPEGAFWCFTDFKGQNKAFTPPFPPCNVLPLFKLHTESNEHPNRERRRGVWILLFSEVTLFFKYIFVTNCRLKTLTWI